MKKTTKPSTVNQKPELLTANKPELIKSELFPIVGIGASAGGLEALEQFFLNMPPNSGMGFVVIQHLDPNHKGMMRELLQRVTKMEVITATDHLKVKANCIYIIPPNKSMSILNGSLFLFEPIKTSGLLLPIDYFLRSLADDYEQNAVGIILSGMGSDGSLGIRAIKEKAGLVLVQDPANAKFDSMPRSAIDAVLVDIVANADELPGKLIACKSKTFNRLPEDEIIKDISSIEKIIILLRAQTGNDFSEYKKTTLHRRIERRMNIHQIDKIAIYVRYLQENPAEVEILFRELLIGVTNFFRDKTVWDYLKNNIIPSLIEKAPERHIFRVWIAGCSTGEEAYSLAIIFREEIERLAPEKNLSLQIFATDLDVTAIEKARKGLYPANVMADVSVNRLNQFFTINEDYYRINSEIREMVVFAPHNVIKDAPFTRLDMLLCRNLLIYLEPELQKKLLALFHYSLKSDGILILGTAETLGAQSEMFRTLETRLRIYQQIETQRSEELFDFPSSFSHSNPIINKNLKPVKITDNIQTLTDQLLLQQFSPASVLVSNQGDILYITGSTGKYLEPAAGKANLNIFAMAREGLRDELPVTFRKALQSFEAVILPYVKIGSNNHAIYTRITIQQIEKPLALKGKVLIIFADVPEIKKTTQKSGIKTILKSDFTKSLELNLLRAKEELQSTREEMQTSQEELKSTNEELQSTNEELQSTNEELTTSKEEMQSLNEELHSVNAELQSKLDEFTRVNNDMNNLLNSIEVATLFLDKDLKIRKYTQLVTKIFKLKESDIGRVFTDQVTDLNYPEMFSDAKEVLRTLVFQEKIVATHDGRWFSIRIMPYRTYEDRIDGLVITFINVTNSVLLENSLNKTQMILKSFIDHSNNFILGLSADGKIIEFNPEAEKLLEHKRELAINKDFVDTFIPESMQIEVRAEFKKLFSGNFPCQFDNELKTASGEIIKIKWIAHQLVDKQHKLAGIIAIGEKTTGTESH